MRLFHVSDLHLGIRLMNYDLTEEIGRASCRERV